MSTDKESAESDSRQFYAAKAAYNQALKAHRTQPLTQIERNALWPSKVANVRKLVLLEREMEAIRARR